MPIDSGDKQDTRSLFHNYKGNKLVSRKVETFLETTYGVFRAIGYEENRGLGNVAEHVALVKGDVESNEEPILVRLHSKCTTSEALQSVHCDCNLQLTAAFEMISERSFGVIVYLDQEGRGIGLLNKLAAYALQNTGKFDTVTANVELGFAVDERDYMAGVEILRDLNVTKVELITDNPRKIEAIKQQGIEVTRVPLNIEIPEQAKGYILTKIQKLNYFSPSSFENQNPTFRT